MDKYLISSNGLFRYKSMDVNMLGNCKIMFLDSVVEGEEDTSQNPFMSNVLSNSMFSSTQTLSIKVFEKTLNPDNIKKISTKEVHKLYEDVISAYYDNAFNKKEGDEFDNNKFTVNIIDDELEQSKRNITVRIMNTSNIMSIKNIFGPANLAIMSQEIYDKLSISNPYNGIKFIVNPTSIHNDKIILVKLNEDLSQTGISVFTDYQFENSRLLKLENVLKKMCKIVDDRQITYNIDSLGTTCKYTTGIIYINK